MVKTGSNRRVNRNNRCSIRLSVGNPMRSRPPKRTENGGPSIPCSRLASSTL